MGLKEPKNKDAVVLEVLQTEFYASIQEKPQLFIETEHVENQLYLLSPKNLIILFVFERYKLESWIDLNVLVVPRKANNNNNPTLLLYECMESSSSTRKLIQITKDPSNIIEMKVNNTSADIELCEQRPSVKIREKKMIISGLFSVLRFLFKYCCYIRGENDDKTYGLGSWNLRNEMYNLLGFRGSCFQSCTSVLAQFCENNMTETMILKLKHILENLNFNLSNSEWNMEIPQDLLRLEHHLAQPVKIHNFGKRSNGERKVLSGENTKTNQNPESTTPTTPLNHDFVEGPDITLSDLILYPCVTLAVNVLGTKIFSDHLINVYNWYQRVYEHFGDTKIKLQFQLSQDTLNLRNQKTIHVSVPEFCKESLYLSDRTRYNPKLRQYTKQEEINDALHVLSNSKFTPLSTEADLSFERKLVDWNLAPELVHPDEGGRLPAKRIQKKCDQLANLAQMVNFVLDQRTTLNDGRVEEDQGCKIVDFCSGGGHLGILIAWIFPSVQVVLVENREESLRRALERIEKLKLNNISVFQSNLNSYDGHFDIGIGLHCCGSALDLVLEKCLRSSAAFVCVPCCYGSISIQSNHLVHYPRSSYFQQTGLSLKQYLVLAHTSDQTHDEKNLKTEQGKYSMRIIDTDRLLYMQLHGYQTWLTKIIPESASPKNHILVGIHI